MDMFKETAIKGVRLAQVKRYTDSRGWLVETFRTDWLETPDLQPALPAMAYVSLTHPGVARGPHEHSDQTDYLGFLGPSTFKVRLWDNRPGSPSETRKSSDPYRGSHL